MTATMTARLAALLPISLRRSTPPDQSAGTRQAPLAVWTAVRQALLRLAVRAKRNEVGEGIELVDRLSLGGKRALLLVAVDGRRMLVGVGEDGAPSISALEGTAPFSQRSADCQQARRVSFRRRGARAGATR